MTRDAVLGAPILESFVEVGGRGAALTAWRRSIVERWARSPGRWPRRQRRSELAIGRSAVHLAPEFADHRALALARITPATVISDLSDP